MEIIPIEVSEGRNGCDRSEVNPDLRHPSLGRDAAHPPVPMFENLEQVARSYLYFQAAK